MRSVVCLLVAANAAAYRVSFLRHGAPKMQYEVQAPMVKVFGETQEYKFMTLQPTFTVADWTKTKTIMEDYLACARTETSGCMYCGWSISGDQLFCRVAHVDGVAVLDHLQNVGECLDKLLAAGVATLDEISLHGPADELTTCKAAIDAMGSGQSAPPPPPPPPKEETTSKGLFGLFGGGASPPPPRPRGNGPAPATAARLQELTQYYEIDSGISFITKETGGVSMGQRLVTQQQSFQVSDWAKAKVAMDGLVEAAEKEGGCVYFGWTRCGDELFCREAYTSAKGLLSHLDDVWTSPDAKGNDITCMMQQLTAPGVATIVRTQIHGPMAQVQLLKTSFTTYGLGGSRPKSQFDSPVDLAVTNEAAVARAKEVVYFNLDSGFQRYEAVRLGGFES